MYKFRVYLATKNLINANKSSKQNGTEEIQGE